MSISFKNIDWLLLLFLVPIILAGLFTMKSFGETQGAEQNIFFNHQLIWLAVSLIAFFILSISDLRFLRRTDVLLALFLFFCGLLAILFFAGHVARGAQSWFKFLGVSFQPSDFMKLVLVLVLAKYFSRRHVAIADFRHIFISGLYAFVPFTLVLLQPDFGGAMVIFLVWLGMTLVSGLSKKHLLFVVSTCLILFLILWSFVLRPYQKARIVSFINPVSDVQGTGYNALQSMIAVGSGQIFGKGVGFGTQSRLQFLPEYETDFIFSAFAEEWGFIGVIIVLLLYGLVIWRILSAAMVGGTNFEILYGMGIAIYFMSHIAINIGMNIGLLPITGISLPFMSYGGSHLLTEFIALGILMSMRQYQKAVHRDDMVREFVGVEKL